MTATVDRKTNNRLMVAQAGNEKFNQGEKHPQCTGCLQQMLIDPMDEKFEALRSKLKKTGVLSS
jgi:hypothetical protein